MNLRQLWDISDGCMVSLEHKEEEFGNKFEMEI